MSEILIRGMYMPLNCNRCSLRSEISRYCNVAHKNIPLIGQPEWCPLIELPEHGRLIDADALIANLKKDPLFPLVELYGIEGVINAQDTIIPASGGGA